MHWCLVGWQRDGTSPGLECRKPLYNQIPKHFPDFYRYPRFLKALEWRNAEALPSCPIFQKKSPPAVWLSDQSWHPQTHPSPGSTTFLATSSEHLPACRLSGVWVSSPKTFLFPAVQSTAPGWEIRGWMPRPPGWLDPADQLGAKNRRRQEKDGSQGSLLPPWSRACPGSSRDEVWCPRALLQPAGSRTGRLFPQRTGKAEPGWIREGIRVLRPARSGMASSIPLPEGCSRD